MEVLRGFEERAIPKPFFHARPRSRRAKNAGEAGPSRVFSARDADSVLDMGCAYFRESVKAKFTEFHSV